ncbi:hypothetical protein B4065_1473 [Caldibacillus thermoamylovorans]|nr:hypothetical protein B4065_1473 [Caldibacillus thermoamylovorans]
MIEKNKNSIWIHRELKPGEIVYYHYEDIFHFEDKLFLSKVYKAGTIDEAFQAIHNFWKVF